MSTNVICNPHVFLLKLPLSFFEVCGSVLEAFSDVFLYFFYYPLWLALGLSPWVSHFCGLGSIFHWIRIMVWDYYRLQTTHCNLLTCNWLILNFWKKYLAIWINFSSIFCFDFYTVEICCILGENEKKMRSLKFKYYFFLIYNRMHLITI